MAFYEITHTYRPGQSIVIDAPSRIIAEGWLTSILPGGCGEHSPGLNSEQLEQTDKHAVRAYCDTCGNLYSFSGQCACTITDAYKPIRSGME